MSWIQKRLFTVVVCLVIGGLLVAVGFVANKNQETVDNLRESCKPTELFVVGNKGFITTVYDCSE